jgi:hypothetical protein
VSLSNSDKAFLLEELNNTLTRFKEDENRWENHTKAEYIKKCDELVARQVEEGVIAIETTGISSYLYKKINEYGIKVSDQYIRDIIPEEHTRNYNKSQLSLELEEDKWEQVETEDPSITIEKNQYNEIKINGKLQKEVKEAPKVVKEEKPKQVKDTRTMVYLQSLDKLTNKFNHTIETLIKRYNASDEAQNILDEVIGDVEEKMKEYAKMWANIENSKNIIDLRRDWGEYEKIMGTILIETGESIAKVAKVMDYSEKYGSIGLLREPKVREFFENPENYPLYLRSCPKCFTDIATVMNEAIALYRECKDLNIDIPVVKYKYD